MLNEDDWGMSATGRSRMLDWSNGALRGAMLFGVLAIALALFTVPLLNRGDTVIANRGGIDMMTTGSTAQQHGTYTLRRSVLQRSPSSVCIIHADSTRSGDC